MATFPTQAKVVIIGAGIVGNSVAYHLADLGWKDIVLIDKGPMPNPGGSTGHASNFIYLTDHNKEMAELTLESARQYREWGVYTECGGIEVARTEVRMNELRRRMDSSKNWRIDSARLLTPAEIKELVPFINEGILVGGFYVPEVGVCDSLRFGTMCREKAEAMGALTVFANTEVTAMGVEDGRIRSVTTSRGTVEAEYVVIACGVWAPLLAEMAGSHIPLTPVVHQMIDVGPVPLFEESSKAIEFPIVRDMDVLMYERQDGIGLEVGSYAHRSILHDPETIPSIEEATLSPTEFPFTPDGLRPADGGRPRAVARDPRRREGRREVRDQRPDRPDARRHAAASARRPRSRASGPPPRSGSRRARRSAGASPSGWSTASPSIDCNQSDISRFHAHQKTRQHTKARAFEAFPKTYGIVHPAEQYLSDRHLRCRRCTSGSVAHDAEFFEVAGWERTQWYDSNAPLRREVRRADAAERVGRSLVEPDHQRRAPRDARVGRHLRPLGVRDLRHRRPGRAGVSVQKVAMRQMDVKVGRVVYTPVLSETGGFKTDLTIMRLEKNVFRVVTGGAHGMADLKWFKDHLEDDAALVDQTTAFTTIGVWGPNARETSSSRSPARTCPTRHSGSAPASTVEIGSQLDARVADQLRRRPGLGALRTDGAGPAALGRALGGRPAASA